MPYIEILILAAVLVLGAIGGIIMYMVRGKSNSPGSRRYRASDSTRDYSSATKRRMSSGLSRSHSTPPSSMRAGPDNPFPNQAATLSLVAPFVAMGISVLLQPQARGHRWAMGILSAVSILLILAGLVFGIIALFTTRGQGRRGIKAKAMVGTVICGLLTVWMLMSIPGLIRTMQKARAIQEQRMEQTTP